MSEVKLPNEYIPYKKIWVCGNIFNNGKILFELEGKPIFLIGKNPNTHRSIVWLNFPKVIEGKPKWIKAIEANKAIETGFEVFESDIGCEININGLPLIHYNRRDDALSITLINLMPIGLNIFGGLKSLSFSGNILESNTFNNVHTMIGIGK